MITIIFAFAISAGALLRSSSADPADAWHIIRDAQHSVEIATDRAFERKWTAVIARAPDDRRALLALGALAQLRYQYERADSLYDRIARLDAGGSQYAAGAHALMAIWRSIGSDAARADSLFVQARAEDLAAGGWHVAFQAIVNVAKLRSRRAGPKVGLDLLREARALARNPIPDERAQLLCTEGLFMEQAGDTTGRRRLDEGIRVARQGNALRELGVCDVGFATIAERLQFFDVAEVRAGEAVRIFEQIHFPHGAASASQWLGHARLTRGDFAAARVDLDRAVRDAQIARFTQTEAWARTGLADLFFALGDVESARVQAARAAAIHASYGDLWGFAVDRQFEGSVAEARGALDDACAKYAQSVSAFDRAGLSFDALGSLRSLALAHMRAGRLDSAQHTLDEGTRLARASGNAGWQNEVPAQLARIAMLRGDLRSADSLLGIARPRFAWRAGDSSNLATLPFAAFEAQLALRMHRVASADSAVAYLSAAIARRRRGMSSADLRAGLAQLRSEWGGLSDVYPELVAGLVANGRLGSAFRFIESVRAREIADANLRTIGRMQDSSAALAGFRRLGNNVGIGIDDVRRRLATDEAFVEFTVGTAGAPTTAIIVTTDTAVAISLGDRASVAPLIERYDRVAATGVEPVAASRQLGAALLQPVVRALPARVTRLAISPDGELYRLPFDALRLNDDHFAVERFTISIVPSGTVALELRDAQHPSAATRLVAVGDPAFSRERDGRRVELRADATPVDSTARFSQVSLARLPRSADEAERVGRYGLKSVVLTRGEANEGAVRKLDWGDVAVVHFATHALMDGEGQARTALALAPSGGEDGFLTPAEVASMHFNGALVVLSACETLGGQILGGEGLRGLVGPMFEAGARAVVVTHWSIGDRTVLPFVDRFYASMAAGQSVGGALREAKLAAIRDGARISDWAAFAVIGDASMHPALRRANLPPLAWLRDAVQTTRDTSSIERR